MNIERTNRTAWIGLGVVLILGLAAFSAMGAGMFGWHPGLVGSEGRSFVGMGPWFWGFGLIGLIVRVAVWGALIMFAVSFFRRRSAGGGFRSQQHSSLEILKQRFAAGEISREQFEDMRRVLDPSVATQ
jgi:putative membrane protein